MKNLFDWHHSLVYGDKSRSEYNMDEEGSLDNLLYQMYMMAHDCEGLLISNAVKALNTAYYLAVAIYNTPHVEERNRMDFLISMRINEILAEEHDGEQRHVTLADSCLVSWMIYAILKLQVNKPAGLEAFLESYLNIITWSGEVYDDNTEEWKQCRFVFDFPKLLKNNGERPFDSDLRPNGMFCSSFTDRFWKKEIAELSFEEIECLMKFNRDKSSQMALLNWILAMSEKYPANSRFNNEDYLLLDSNIRHDVYLPREKKVELPSLPKVHDEEIKRYHKQCQTVLDLYLNKINVQKALLDSVKKKLESNEAVIVSNNLIIDFNTKLEDRYRKLLKKYEEESKENKKALADLHELSDRVLEENKQLKEELEKWKNTGLYDMDWLHEPDPVETAKEMQLHEEVERLQADFRSESLMEFFGFCIKYVSNIDEVQDSQVESIKDMLESLMEAPLAAFLVDSDKLALVNQLHSIKKQRKSQATAHKNEAKILDKPMTINYNGSIGMQIEDAKLVNVQGAVESKAAEN